MIVQQDLEGGTKLVVDLYSKMHKKKGKGWVSKVAMENYVSKLFLMILKD